MSVRGLWSSDSEVKEDSFLEVGAFVFFEGLNACFFVMNELISCLQDGMWGLVEPNAEDVTSRCEINIETSVGAKRVGRSEVDVLTGDGDFLKLSKVVAEAFASCVISVTSHAMVVGVDWYGMGFS